ncbi:hypothetical protein ORV05_10105 [Amycolatopsis cynarae]|uniref:Uncharacterized protein n=1 Tax=Amycolatopsis cynarae TaxID=2995223 RepID=A0ABY7BBR6_9PSEU|nr:hypothetical protein [Amycolatopsis sp. HUAS 11-8]WAL68093.1 hypothetical protein ORV05_10105 [Amycolatopsis sp. HUAS 11-8]
MTDELSLPPRRELPPDVRARLRAEVAAGFAEAPKRGRVVAVAAAVALLAGGAVAATQLARPSHDVSAASDGGGAPSTGLDRCWAAVEKAGKTAAVPDRSKWVTTFTAAEGDDVVEAFTAAGKAMFCETTATTATLSNPDVRTDGGKTRLLFYTGTGLVAGVADASWDSLALSMPDGLGVAMAKPQGPAHQFTAFTHTDPAKTHLFAAPVIDGRISATARVDLAAIPAPLVSVTDRAADRKSPAGQALGTCLAQVAQPPADADSYQPGALLENGAYRVVLGRNAGHTVACTTEPGANGTTYHLYRDTFIGQSIPARRLSVPELGGKVPFVGIVPPSAASMKADFGQGKPFPITVTNGTFAAWLPDGAKAIGGRPGESWVLVEDARGAALFNGYVPMK